MSRFWAGGSSSESENESESDSDSSVQQNQKIGGGKFIGAFESDSESEDEVRVVKSKKDKSWDSMRDAISRMRSAMKINDWSIILDEFKAINKIVEKSKMLILKNGLPKFYVKILVDVEDFLNQTLKDKESIKKMKKEVAKSFNTMKLTVRKHNKAYEAEIEACRANPQDYTEESSDEEDSSSEEDSSDEDSSDEDSDEDSDEESESENEAPVKSNASKVKFAMGSDSDEDSEDSWPSDSDDSSSDSSDDEDDRGELKGRERWLKKKVDTSALDKKKAKQQAKKARSSGPSTKASSIESRVKSASSHWKIDENMTEEVIDRKVKEIVSSRGRKSSLPDAMIYQLEVLAKVARYYGPHKEIPILGHLISAMFDANNSLDSYMDLRTWRTCWGCMMRIATLLEENNRIILGVLSAEDLTDFLMADKMQNDLFKKNEEDSTPKSSDPNKIYLVGDMETHLVRLEREYTKSLQQINPHTQDYVIRLSDEALLLELAEGLQKYYTRVGNKSAIASVALLRLEHLYYKNENMAREVHRAYLFAKKWGRYSDLHPACTGKISDNVTSARDSSTTHPAAFQGNPSVSFPDSHNASKEVEELCSIIFKVGDGDSKSRALLCAVFHHAMHDRYYRARDLFLISHIQDNIEDFGVSTQILYNRAIVTLGLAAFRQGHIMKAYECLGGVCGGRVKELLAQGTIRWHDKGVEQENEEKRRQIPYHMHINPDLLDCCYMICAMMVELPFIVGKPYDRSVLARFHFRKYLNGYNRQLFTGPPENTREHVLAAAKALMTGDWKKAVNYILNLDVWNLIPNDGGAKVKEMLNIKLKEEALRIYLYSSVASNYESLSLSSICSQFDMDSVTSRRIISKMIFRNEVSGAWDQSANGDDVLVLYNVGATPMQTLALQMADKVSNLVESNERILDSMTSTYGYKDDWNQQRKPHDSQYQGQQRAKGGLKGPAYRGQNRHQSGGKHGSGKHSRNPRAGNAWSNQGKSKTSYKSQQIKNSISKKTTVMGWGAPM
mmetsp:Transcript_14560/g.21940  ORF Transcript_14560/g.21940 Transcript_14560/m.21940 type:complete len:1011 (-) Transcript_14560:147-3179(-)